MEPHPLAGADSACQQGQALKFSATSSRGERGRAYLAMTGPEVLVPMVPSSTKAPGCMTT